MDQQIFTWPCSANAASLIRNPKSLLSIMSSWKNGILQLSEGERLWALTEIYLELSLPLPIALRAAEADLYQVDVEKPAGC
jgi:hypothetical protein